MHALQTLEVTTHASFPSPSLSQRPCVSDNLASQPLCPPPSFVSHNPTLFCRLPPTPHLGASSRKPMIAAANHVCCFSGSPWYQLVALTMASHHCSQIGTSAWTVVSRGRRDWFKAVHRVECCGPGNCAWCSLQMMHVMCTVPALAAYEAQRTPSARLTLVMLHKQDCQHSHACHASTYASANCPMLAESFPTCAQRSSEIALHSQISHLPSPPPLLPALPFPSIAAS